MSHVVVFFQHIAVVLQQCVSLLQMFDARMDMIYKHPVLTRNE